MYVICTAVSIVEHTLNSQMMPYNSPASVIYMVIIVSICRETNCVIIESHWSILILLQAKEDYFSGTPL